MISAPSIRSLISFSASICHLRNVLLLTRVPLIMHTRGISWQEENSLLKSLRSHERGAEEEKLKEKEAKCNTVLHNRKWLHPWKNFSSWHFYSGASCAKILTSFSNWNHITQEKYAVERKRWKADFSKWNWFQELASNRDISASLA